MDSMTDLPVRGNDEPTSQRRHYSAFQCVLPFTEMGFSAHLWRLFPVNNVDVTVFLVSLKAGGVALNLTEASRVYLMDSWWNPAVRLSRCHILSPRLRSCHFIG